MLTQHMLNRLFAETSRVRAVIFAAACAERAVEIASWAAALDGRPDDAVVYVEALEFLWRPQLKDTRAFDAKMAQLEKMREMALADELIGPPAYGFHSVLVLHSGLRVAVETTLENVEDCSMAARNAAFRLERLIRSAHYLLSAEERSQYEDIDALLQGATADELRDRARRAGRSRLSLFRSHSALA
ncbi:hypothetical protein [Actinoplanes sp. HUAS TT8]|uniref:hypothetical protein n=1 Tax=Actinoplanes sp. HUAS TT8 TaxID=3447453 RepID=UPI003F51C987